MDQSKAKNIAAWVFQVLIAVLFLIVSFPKLTSNPDAVEAFRNWGMPDKFYLLIGTLELLGAIGLLIPRTAGLAAVGLMGIMIGATATHITHSEWLNALAPISVMLALLFVAYVRLPLTLRKKVSA